MRVQISTEFRYYYNVQLYYFIILRDLEKKCPYHVISPYNTTNHNKYSRTQSTAVGTNFFFILHVTIKFTAKLKYLST